MDWWSDGLVDWWTFKKGMRQGKFLAACLFSIELKGGQCGEQVN